MMKTGYTIENIALDNGMAALLFSQPELPEFFLSEVGFAPGRDNAPLIDCMQPLSEFPASAFHHREEIIWLGIDMCKAVAFLHRHNIIHGYINPGCIYSSGNNRFLLGSPVQPSGSAAASHLINPYTAPELLKNGKCDSSVDTYSIGKLLENYLSGCSPSPGFDRLAEISRKACATEAEKRYFSPLLFCWDLQALLSTQDRSLSLGSEEFLPSITLLFKSSHTHVTFSGTIFTIGRSSSCSITLQTLPQHRKISRRHAVIYPECGSWYLRDMHSKNGTMLNGMELSSFSSYLLHENDIISLASAETIIFMQGISR